MVREGKGVPEGHYIQNYCVVDLETTGLSVSTAKIVEIAAVKVRQGNVIDTFSTLINPECLIPAEATAVNHITNEMVQSAPTLDSIIDKFLDFVGTDVIVGYNSASYDMNIIYDAVESLSKEAFKNNYIDLLHVVRRANLNTVDKKLETISKFFELDTEGEHRALTDCYLTQKCYESVFEMFGEEPFQGSASIENSTLKRFHYSDETIALRELNELISSIICDGVITIDEFMELSIWLDKHFELRNNNSFSKVYAAIDDILEDGIVTTEELDSLKTLLCEFLDPVSCKNCCDGVSSICDKHICVTGDFDYGTRNEVIQLIEQSGGIIDNSVKRATNILVVGTKGSDQWKTEKYGGKVQKAMELQEKGFDIVIIKESDFIPMIVK